MLGCYVWKTISYPFKTPKLKFMGNINEKTKQNKTKQNKTKQKQKLQIENKRKKFPFNWLFFWQQSELQFKNVTKRSEIAHDISYVSYCSLKLWFLTFWALKIYILISNLDFYLKFLQ